MQRFLNLKSLLASLEVDPATLSDPVKRMFIVEGDGLTANIATGVDKGNSLHTQPQHDELLVVLEGEAEFQVGDEQRHVSPGDLIFIPRNTLHGRVRTLTERWAVLSIYAPAFDRTKKNIRWDRDAS